MLRKSKNKILWLLFILISLSFLACGEEGAESELNMIEEGLSSEDQLNTTVNAPPPSEKGDEETDRK